jgi:hypothetical protein
MKPVIKEILTIAAGVAIGTTIGVTAVNYVKGVLSKPSV